MMTPLLYESGCQDQTDNNQSQNDQRRRRKAILCSSGLVGLILGTLIQTITCLAFGMFLQFTGKNSKPQRESDMLVFSLLAILSQLDVISYAAIWILFTCTLTKAGSNYVRKKFDLEESKDQIWTGRFLFMFSMLFLFGLVVGSFLGWTLVDFLLGKPVPLMPFVWTLILDLFLCFAMIWCYDLGHPPNLSKEEKDEEANAFFV